MIPLITSYLMSKKVNMEENFYFLKILISIIIITNLAEPQKDGDAITKKYFERNAVLSQRRIANPLRGNLDMDGNRIFDLPNPTGPSQPATESFVENKVNDYLKKDGTTAMTGNLQMGSKKITDLADPDQDNEAVNKGYLVRKLANVDLTD